MSAYLEAARCFLEELERAHSTALSVSPRRVWVHITGIGTLVITFCDIGVVKPF